MHVHVYPRERWIFIIFHKCSIAQLHTFGKIPLHYIVYDNTWFFSIDTQYSLIRLLNPRTWTIDSEVVDQNSHTHIHMYTRKQSVSLSFSFHIFSLLHQKRQTGLSIDNCADTTGLIRFRVIIPS